ncbi:uncharacterized protein CEXT_146231 [Caerostris extrusa]|uniref:Uncharacterized protein n=1 Tax=Caerostris extrusa TaxID=172846 RepID=A0AAV4XPA7_CAEEX|nr:uncharacterized protein CEXT_146231 [Caerostris extrusa]
MLSLTQDLNDIYKMLPKRSFRRQKYPFMIYIFFFLLLLLLWGIAVFMTGLNVSEMQRYLFEMDSTMKLFRIEATIFFPHFSICGIPFCSITCIVFILFVTYYSLLCIFIRIFFEHLIRQVAINTSDEKQLLNMYFKTSKSMSKMDEEFSRPAFISVLMGMIGLFWVGYILAFEESKTLEVFLALVVFSGCFYSSILVLVIISGSLTNEAANEVTGLIQCLPYRLPTQRKEMEFSIKGDLIEDNSLTLWKFYVLSRSLLLSSLGTLLTYGILLGTLGKE